jgi:uncharacterized protein YyaL (SSP411 family)
MPNALAREPSPYLLQHADNPVDWLPWGEAAFARARAEHKPIFLSIGYSTCHWCHVMAHESFEDADTAALLNAHFVSIKVDREERPDVDRVYLTYVQAMTGHGGWPLSAWLTPELKPFFGGTYFPPVDWEGRPGFPTILRAIARAWQENRAQLVAEGERAIRVLQEHRSGPARATAAQETLAPTGRQAWDECFRHFADSFDAERAGFGGAPKFPRASNLNFLFRIAAIADPGSAVGTAAVRMATATLQAMARGGLHDHVGGGYHRYSVDAGWFVPHFEKMLYDQAQIALNCLEARQVTGDERYAWMARDIFDYVARDLTSPQGAFYTAEDADSAPPEGGPPTAEHGAQANAPGARRKAHAEGAFYLWAAAELRAVLGGEYEFFAGHFGVQEGGNVPAGLDPHGEFRSKNLLAQQMPLAETARRYALTPEQASDRLQAHLSRLREIRARRPRPQLDDKIVTANNALMISALAKAHRVLGPGHGFLEAAVRAADFIAREMYHPERGVLFRMWRATAPAGGPGTRGAAEGFAEDYAYFVQALLDLYEASFDIRWLQWAERLQAKMDERFWDEAGGGYFNSAAGDPSIVLRLKEDYDGAEPAPGSVAAMNLLRLAVFLGKGGEGRPEGGALDYRERGQRTIQALQPQWSRVPQALPQLLCALEFLLQPPRQVVIAGDPGAGDFQALAAVVGGAFGPQRTVLAADGGPGQEWLARRAPWLAAMRPIAGRATAYLCEEYTCEAPITDPAELARRLQPRQDNRG